MTQAKIKIGIVGGTGFTGVELLRMLSTHDQVQVAVITARSEAGMPVAEMFPNLRGVTDLVFREPELESLSQCDLVFFATPHGVAMEMAPALVEAGVRVIDLGADFRLEDLGVWSQWYGMEHSAEILMRRVAYGLPEWYRQAISQARVIANPGCYPTAILLGALPFLKAGLVKSDGIVADGKSGVSGGGRGAKVAMLGAEMSESFKAYGISGHRHLPEIQEKASQVAEKPVSVTFVPHLVPMVRGMETTLYLPLTDPASSQAEVAALQSLLEATYADEPFVDVMPPDSLPETRSVRGSNLCRLSLSRPQNGNTLVVTSVIDNLVKGAAGQAIQNMNILFGWPEDKGLQQIGLMP
ncbi:MAG: N-acetyl-gamma-glutamyl-phosphate reductase [Hydrogenovibrio sp.]|uniref:N-acetyl-gamma-glutamyl-phosphate reductase n=1 Tax=Hydrogenovibrio sp. TaxID=2065821 RepID=UPI0028707CDB|nr:N-acetyl-gamma-glutamyl-phosphate reductase [Hydrogenovibrio sp.]MDR9498853.1 N-acetyl-gamma-glutamyl-phosphate reductase [Hydrogenovibrio sp.]